MDNSTERFKAQLAEDLAIAKAEAARTGDWSAYAELKRLDRRNWS